MEGGGRSRGEEGCAETRWRSRALGWSEGGSAGVKSGEQGAGVRARARGMCRAAHDSELCAHASARTRNAAESLQRGHASAEWKPSQ
eukprot:3508582-Rhodomonas_salina.2